MARWGKAAAALLAAALAGCSVRGGGRPGASVVSCSHLRMTRPVLGRQTLCEDLWTCPRPPAATPADRIGLHRLARCEDSPGGAAGPVVLYFPGMYMNAELPFAEPRYDLRLFLASNGVRAWGVDYRTHFVPAEGEKDLRFMDKWTTATFVDDLAWAAAFVRSRDPGPLFLAGFSRGAFYAYTLGALLGPRVVRGLIVLDGTGEARAPAPVRGPVLDLGGGRLSYRSRQALIEAVLANPQRPSPIPGFSSAGSALATILYHARSFGGRGGLANARDGISTPAILARLLATYDRYWPAAELRGTPRRAAAHGNIPVLAFASTNAGPRWVEAVRRSALAVGGPQAEIHELGGWGHLDLLVANHARARVFVPTLRWVMALGAKARGG